jgi:hypothetical protein
MSLLRICIWTHRAVSTLQGTHCRPLMASYSKLHRAGSDGWAVTCGTSNSFTLFTLTLGLVSRSWSSHSGSYKKFYFLEQPTFRSDMSPSSGSKNKPSKKSAEAICSSGGQADLQRIIRSHIQEDWTLQQYLYLLGGMPESDLQILTKYPLLCPSLHRSSWKVWENKHSSLPPEWQHPKALFVFLRLLSLEEVAQHISLVPTYTV